MEDTRKIVVEIVNREEIESKQQTNKKEDSGEVEVNLSFLLHPIKNTQTALLGKSVFVNQAFDLAKNSIGQAITLSANRYFNMKEDYLTENMFNSAKTTINKVANFGTSIISGGIAGSSVGGPIGAVIGASISAVSFGITEVLNYQARISSYYQSLNASNYQIGFMRTRAGLTNGSKGTEN